MQEMKKFDDEIVEVAVTEILDAEERREPITVCVAATGCVQVTHTWDQ